MGNWKEREEPFEEESSLWGGFVSWLKGCEKSKFARGGEVCRWAVLECLDWVLGCRKKENRHFTSYGNYIKNIYYAYLTYYYQIYNIA